jgi:hypothetical protein
MVIQFKFTLSHFYHWKSNAFHPITGRSLYHFTSGAIGSGCVGCSGCIGVGGVSGTFGSGVGISGLLGPGVISGFGELAL